MIGLLRAVGERGERALRRGVWSFAGAGLIVVALGFAGAAIVEALAAFLPRYAALGAATLFLLIAAAVCFSLASKKSDAAPADAPAPQSAQAAFAAPADWRSALNLALVEEAREKPARAAALAALAGLILGVLEGLDDQKSGGADGA